jgi:hypothetical protein
MPDATLPDFLGIGAQKAATTWLADNLRQHPGVFIPRLKEQHFWDRLLDRGLDWYAGQFARAPAGASRGEITPAYAVLPDGIVSQIAAALPDVRLIYLIRDPAERAWSGALMALKAVGMTLDEASDQWFIDHFRSATSRTRGDYAACLTTWLRHYPREQILIERFENVESDPEGVLGRVADHIRVPRMGGVAVADKVFAGPGHPLPPRLRELAVEMYAPKVRNLESLLGIDLHEWRS